MFIKVRNSGRKLSTQVGKSSLTARQSLPTRGTSGLRWTQMCSLQTTLWAQSTSISTRFWPVSPTYNFPAARMPVTAAALSLLYPPVPVLVAYL